MDHICQAACEYADYSFANKIHAPLLLMHGSSLLGGTLATAGRRSEEEAVLDELLSRRARNDS